jgi:hypothetical protein
VWGGTDAARSGMLVGPIGSSLSGPVRRHMSEPPFKSLHRCAKGHMEARWFRIIAMDPLVLAGASAEMVLFARRDSHFCWLALLYWSLPPWTSMGIVGPRPRGRLNDFLATSTASPTRRFRRPCR